MAEDKSSESSAEDKTEEPTAHRLEQALKEGQVAFSREIVHWSVIAASAAILLFAGPYVAGYIAQDLKGFIARPHDFMVDEGGLVRLLSSYGFRILAVLIAPAVILIAVILGMGFLQTKFVISWKAVAPKAERVSPRQGLKRMLSKQGLIEYAKNLLKVGCITFGIVVVLKEHVRYLDDWMFIPIQQIGAVVMDEMQVLFVTLLIILGLIAILDYVYQRFQYMQKLRMTRQEVKEEYKDTEGDPVIKDRIRRVRVERARKRMMAAVPSATVVVTNPTHFAVALAYDELVMHAPKVVAKGADAIAKRIREVAQEHKVPIVENPPLARALYDSVKLDQEIPAEHYKAVADVIKLVMSLKKKYF